MTKQKKTSVWSLETLKELIALQTKKEKEKENGNDRSDKRQRDR